MQRIIRRGLSLATQIYSKKKIAFVEKGRMTRCKRFTFGALVVPLTSISAFSSCSSGKSFIVGQALRGKRYQANHPSSHHATETDDEYNELQLALQRGYERDMGINIDNEERDSRWFLKDENSILPFDCTSCGKCCKTKGTVFMSPDEAEAASVHLDLTVDEFANKYATHKARSTVKTNRAWLQIKNKDEEDGGGCIFLDENNLCSIYEARPVQCSTYPFWSNILRSPNSWDAEVREADNSTKGPYWTVNDGGCEGMMYIDEDKDNAVGGVRGFDALRRLKDYERWKTAFQSSGDLKPLTRK